MKVGVFLLTSDPATDPAVIAKKAEDVGFASFLVPEHPIIPIQFSTGYPGSRDGRIPEGAKRIADPFVALARASAVTTKIQLGTGICLVPERNPLLLAKEIASLELLRRAVSVWHRRGLAERRIRNYGRRLCASVGANARCDSGDEAVVDHGRVRIPRQVLQLPAGDFISKARA